MKIKTGDTVTIGRHGKPMTVLTIYKISRNVLVEDEDGTRFIVELADAELANLSMI